MTVHANVRALAVLAGALLLAGGFYAYSLVNAPRAHASTQVTGGLDVSDNSGSTSVGVGTISTTVTYTCTDSGAPGGQAALRVQFDQNDNDASAEVGVACGSSDVNQTQTVQAVQVGMSGSQEVTVEATLTDGPWSVLTAGDTLVGNFNASASSFATYPGDGTVTVTGSYNCASGTTATELVVDVSQINTNPAAGLTGIPISTCNGTNQSFSASVKDVLPRGSFVPTRPLDIHIVSDPSSFRSTRVLSHAVIIGS